MPSFPVRKKVQPAIVGPEIRGHTVPELIEDAVLLNPNPKAFQHLTSSGWVGESQEDLLTASREIALGLRQLGLQSGYDKALAQGAKNTGGHDQRIRDRAQGTLEGDRVAFLLLSDIFFCVADLGCLIANLVDVPIDLSQTLENIIFSLNHSDAKVLVIENHTLLQQISPYLCNVAGLRTIVVVEDSDLGEENLLSSACAPSSSIGGPMDAPIDQSIAHPIDPRPVPESIGLDLSLTPDKLGSLYTCPLPQSIHLISWAQLRERGRSAWSASQWEELKQQRSPQTLASIIYVPDPSGQLKGVMLTHENLSSNALAAFQEMPNLKRGIKEVVVSFLPLTHIFARTLLYGHIYYGHQIYFSSPQQVMRHLQEVHPTILATVPLLLHKVHDKLWSVSSKSESPISLLEQAWAQVWEETWEQGWKKGWKKGWQKRSHLTVSKLFKHLAGNDWVKHRLHRWALHLAQAYELGQRPKGWESVSCCIQSQIAHVLVYRQWRSLFGGRLRFILCGGAALRAEVANLFAAAGLPILQGYGLTQTSSVVSFNRLRLNRANTVGIPALGVDCAIAADGEILVRSPGVTPGYFKAPELTQVEIDEDGWFHTGDLGQFTDEGFLGITGAKKALFKLSTGKYVTPLPLESKLERSPLLDKAMVLGADQKFCGALLFVNAIALKKRAMAMGIGDLPEEALLENPCIIALFNAVVTEANCHFPYWSTIKRFRLLSAHRLEADSLLSPHQEIQRQVALKIFAQDIEFIYQNPIHQDAKRSPKSSPNHPQGESSLCPDIPAVSCPITAQSLKTGLS